MTNYNINKVSPRPWSLTHWDDEPDGWHKIRDANGEDVCLNNGMQFLTDEAKHVIHCVNLHDELVAENARLKCESRCEIPPIDTAVIYRQDGQFVGWEEIPYDELVEALGKLLGAEWIVSHDWGGDRQPILDNAESVPARAKGDTND